MDAFATLLRVGEDGHYYAEDGFIVQLKSESPRPLRYSEHELVWLVGQTQPMFIGRVDLAASRIGLYPTWTVNQACRAMHASGATIHFTTSGLPDFFRDVPTRWVGKSGTDEVIVYIPEPLLSWSLADLSNLAWREAAYLTLSRYLAEHRKAAHAMSFGESVAILWQTNDSDSVRSVFTMAGSSPDGLAETAEKLRPGLRALLTATLGMADPAQTYVALSLIGLAGGLRKAGIEIDPDGLFLKLGGAVLRDPDPHRTGPLVHELTVRIERDRTSRETAGSSE